MPLVVIWCFIALALGTLAGICGYYLAQGFTALLAVIATLLIVFAGILPILPNLIRRTKNIYAAFKYDPRETPDEEDEPDKK